MTAGVALRDPGLVRALADRLAALIGDRALRLMHVCGTHEATVCRYALRELLPPAVRIVAGPGCPVCVCPAEEIDAAVALCARGVTLASFGDMVRVTGSRQILADARAAGGDVRVVSSVRDAVLLARSEPDRQVVFFAVGFETTACTFAQVALDDPPDNFSLLTAIRTVPAALAFLVDGGGHLDGFVLPGHVCAVVGLRPFAESTALRGVPMAVAGFEPVELLHGLLALSTQVTTGQPRCDNLYPALVRTDGNPAALRTMARAFEPCDATWRGIGPIPGSGLRLRPELAHLDARVRHTVPTPTVDASAMPDGCHCGEVLLGLARPAECPHYGTTCTPLRAHGPCMVSHEGSCRIAHEHDGGRIAPAPRGRA